MEDPGSSCPDVAMEDPESASLQAVMDAPITASLGPMAPLLRQLHSRPKGVGDDKIQLLKDDLVGLCISLKEVSEAAGASVMARWWMKEVRELCYDTQDYLDEAFVKHSGDGARRGARLSTGFRVGSKLLWRPQIGRRGQGRCGASRLQQISTKRRNLKRRPRKVAISFSELMARVEVLDDVSQKLELGLEAIKPDHAQAGVRRLTPRFSLHLPLSPTPMSVYSEAGGLSLVGVEEPVNKLVNLLAFDDDSQKQLKVVSIFGFAGVGKTTVATTLYRNFRGKFQCRAFLRVPRTPDMMGILSSILSQIKAPQVGGFPDAQDLIDNIREHLQGKRYFIIIDDLWTTSVWNIISRAFPDSDCCSRIITTSEIEDISLACCSYDSTYIFQMSPLNDDQSRKLFFSRVFGSEDGCPPEFREVSYGIIRKCGGSPLTTVIVASMLAWEPNLVMEQWKHIQDSLPSIMSTNPTSEVAKEVLNLIYNDLPAHLKTCLLHLGMYPEGYTIGKDDLVKQWVAEGLVGIMEEGQNKEKFAGAYFDELVSRGMVQAVDINYSGELLSCTVHQMVLDFIRDKSMEENFAISVDYFQSTLALPDKVRRLSLQFGGAKSAKLPEGIIFSQARSLLFFGFFKCVPLILGYGFLRVLILHIWADEDKIIDVSRISELCRLTYLKIKCNITIKLPAKIGGIQDLRTLEVDARLSAVPSDIVHLAKLMHLRLPSKSYLPHGVGDMTSLRTLGYFDIGGNSEDNVMDLGKLTNLQDLQLTCSTVQPAENLEKNLQLLGSVLEKLSILQSVTLVHTADPNQDTLQDVLSAAFLSIFRDSLRSVSPASALLERIELLPRSCIFPSLPKWFEQLGKLHTLKIAVRELWGEDIRILKALPALTALSLYVQTAPLEIIVFDKTGFLVLSYFKFRCSTPMLKFESDAMPNLVKLKLSFNAASQVEQHVTAYISIEHLSGLKEISTKIRGAGAISIEHLPGVEQISTEMRTEGTDPEWAWRATIINHKNNPTINVKLVGRFSKGKTSMETQDKDEVEDDQVVAGVAAHRRWDMSGSGSPYRFRTSVSSVTDIGNEIVEASQAGDEEVEASRAAEDKVFVAVVEEFKRGKSVLQWALQNLAKDGAQVVVAHVHRPCQMIRTMLGNSYYTSLEPELVKTYRKKELEKAFGKLDEYVLLCKRLEVSCEKIIIENDDVAEGLEELIALHGITKLVMGTEHYSKRLKTPKSKKSLRLMEAGASSCKIWFTCKGELICTREANTAVLVPPSPASTVASTLSASSISSHMRSIMTRQSESEAPSSKGSPWHDLKRSRTDMTQYPSRGAGSTPSQLFEPLELNANRRPTRTPLSSMDSWDEYGRRSQGSLHDLSGNDDAISVSGSTMRTPMHESDDDHFSPPTHELESLGADADIYGRLEEALGESQELKKEAFEESTKRRKAELDLLSALQKTKELEKLYHQEIRERETIEETLVRQTQEIEETKIRCETLYDELHDAQEDKVMSEQHITEMKSTLEDHKYLLEEFQADKEKLQQERDAAVTAAEELRQKNEQRIWMPAEALNTEFSALELEQATRNFDEALKIGESGFGCVYKGSLRSTTVAIKLLHPESLQGQSEFHQEVAVLSRVRHPNLVTLIGSCREAFGLVYEFLPNGNLEDRLACRNGTPPLTWQVRTRIISEICSVLIFLHSNKPHPVVHGDLKPANILLDANLVSKLGDFGISNLLIQSNTSGTTTTLYRTTTPRGTFAYMDPEFISTGELTTRSDVFSFGIIILQLLTGRPPLKIADVVEDAMTKGDLHSIIDPSAGSWPFVQANQLAHLGLRCAEMSRRRRPDLAREVWVVVEPLMKAASMTVRRPTFAAASSDETSAPSYFLCPIFQEMMNDPYIAADGFTYEAEAIRGWLESGHDTSPMTNLKLPHLELTPNRGLRSVILEWRHQHHQGRYHEDEDLLR